MQIVVNYYYLVILDKTGAIQQLIMSFLTILAIQTIIIQSMHWDRMALSTKMEI